MSHPDEIAQHRAAYDPIPTLENGERLTRAEFERRYEAMPELKKAELIEGVVYMPSPVRAHRHGVPHGRMVIWLGCYQVRTPGLVLADNSTVRLDLDNEPQPDVQLFIDPALGGQAAIDDDDYVAGAPELVVEVASSSASYDLGVKKNVFRRNGVREYVVWRVLDRQIDWSVLREGVYEPLARDATGLYRSEVFPGLWLDVAAMLSGDLPAVLDVLQQGLETPEHAALDQAAEIEVGVVAKQRLGLLALPPGFPWSASTTSAPTT